MGPGLPPPPRSCPCRRTARRARVPVRTSGPRAHGKRGARRPVAQPGIPPASCGCPSTSHAAAQYVPDHRGARAQDRRLAQSHLRQLRRRLAHRLHGRRTAVVAVRGRGRRSLLQRLEGRRVRVRGWIERRNGPYVELFHPLQIEDIDGETLPPSSGSPRGAPAPVDEAPPSARSPPAAPSNEKRPEHEAPGAIDL